MKDSSSTLPPALRAALGDVIAEERRAWRRERDAIESEMRAIVAEARATIASERLLGAHINEKPSRVHEVKEFLRAAVDRTGGILVKVRDDAAEADRKRDERFSERMAEMETRAGAMLGATAVTARGTWSKLGTYRQNDIVALNGASFIALRAKPGPCPGPGWQLLAGQGKRGERTAAVVGLAISDAGVLTVRCGDGAVKTLDLAPVLRKFAGRQG